MYYIPPTMYHQCAPNVAYSTIRAIVKTESNFNLYALNLNKGYKLRFQAHNKAQAIHWADYLEEHHYNFDVGLAQINIKNIHTYGYHAKDLFNPCTNLHLADLILQKDYVKAKQNSNTSQEALRKTISSYNTGNFYSGFHNGYVYKVYLNAKHEKNTSVDPIMLAANSYVDSPEKSKTVLYVGQ